MNRSELFTIKKLFINKSLLEIALQVEKLLDDMNLYAYPNWFDGILREGPSVRRYWVKVALKYEYDNMPDPKGAMMLSKLGIIPKFGKITEDVPVELKDNSDFEPNVKKAKLEPKNTGTLPFVHK